MVDSCYGDSRPTCAIVGTAVKSVKRTMEKTIYRASEDTACSRSSGRSMQTVLKRLQEMSTLEVAYLQGCTGMGAPHAFLELEALLMMHPRLWAVNLGELLTSFDSTQYNRLVKCFRASEVVSTYFDQHSSLNWFKREVIAACRANRDKHTRWRCDPGGTGDPKIIAACKLMYYHPRLFKANREGFALLANK